MDYHWPGNVRELANVIERAVITTKSEIINQNDLEFSMVTVGQPMGLPELGNDFALEIYLKVLRINLFKKALEISEGNQSKAARLLGVTPQAVNQFIKEQ